MGFKFMDLGLSADAVQNDCPANMPISDVILTPCDGYVSQPQSPEIVVVSSRFTAKEREENNTPEEVSGEL